MRGVVQKRSLLLGLLFPMGAWACGLTVVGTYVVPVEPTDSGIEASLPEAGGMPDGGSGSDAAVDADATPPDEDAGPPLVFVASATRLWTFDTQNVQWDGGASTLPNATCPAFDELAMNRAGQLYASSADSSKLVRVDDPFVPTCTPVAAAGPYPRALGFAPRGTLDPTSDVLVGYQANGDYVRIDTTTGAVGLVTQGALAGFAVGDIGNAGPKGYAALSGMLCGAGRCIWQVDFATGARVSASPVVVLGTNDPLAAIGHWGGTLYVFSELNEASAVKLGPNVVVSAVTNPVANIAYRGAASRTIAPSP